MAFKDRVSYDSGDKGGEEAYSECACQHIEVDFIVQYAHRFAMIQDSEGEDSEGDSDRGEVDDKEGFVVFSCEFIDIDAIDTIQTALLQGGDTPTGFAF